MGNCSTRAGVWAAAFLCCGLAASTSAQDKDDLPQAPVPNALKLPGGVAVQRPTPGAFPLGLDDAIDRGEKHNLQMLLVIQNERIVGGELLTVKNNLLPSLTASRVLWRHSRSIWRRWALDGSSLAEFGIDPATFPTIVKVNTAEAQISLNQQLFNLPAYYLYRSAQKAADGGEFFDPECPGRSDAWSGDAVSAGAGGRCTD